MFSYSLAPNFFSDSIFSIFFYIVFKVKLFNCNQMYSMSTTLSSKHFPQNTFENNTEMNVTLYNINLMLTYWKNEGPSKSYLGH